MSKLSGEDVRRLAKLLDSTLSLDDLQAFVYASTGDQLFSAYVAKDQPKQPMIRALLIALEDIGTTSDFLAYVYVNRPGRPDVRTEIAKDFPDAVAVSENLYCARRSTTVKGSNAWKTFCTVSVLSSVENCLLL